MWPITKSGTQLLNVGPITKSRTQFLKVWPITKSGTQLLKAGPITKNGTLYSICSFDTSKLSHHHLCFPVYFPVNLLIHFIILSIVSFWLCLRTLKFFQLQTSEKLTKLKLQVISSKRIYKKLKGRGESFLTLRPSMGWNFRKSFWIRCGTKTNTYGVDLDHPWSHTFL